MGALFRSAAARKVRTRRVIVLFVALGLIAGARS
jgi:hypothetical protein